MPPLNNPKHELFAQEYAKGKSAEESMLVAGYSASYARTQMFRLSANIGIRERVSEIQELIVQATLVDARKLHVRWSEMFNADIGDIMGEHGHYKPIHEWPKIWRQMLSGCDVKELFEHSKDGEGASWDKIGEVVKIKFIEQSKLGELIGRHKAVDAFVAQKQGGDVNVLIVTAEKARQIVSARKRLANVVNVTPLSE